MNEEYKQIILCLFEGHPMTPEQIKIVHKIVGIEEEEKPNEVISKNWKYEGASI